MVKECVNSKSQNIMVYSSHSDMFKFMIYDIIYFNLFHICLDFQVKNTVVFHLEIP